MDLAFHTELHAPTLLGPGDSAYIDSKMPHAFLNRGKGKAEMLSLCFRRDMKLPRADMEATVIMDLEAGGGLAAGATSNRGD